MSAPVPPSCANPGPAPADAEAADGTAPEAGREIRPAEGGDRRSPPAPARPGSPADAATAPSTSPGPSPGTAETLGRTGAPAPAGCAPQDGGGEDSSVDPAASGRRPQIPGQSPAGNTDPQAEIFAFLADPRTHGLSGEAVTRIDTHSAVVFLAGPFAYKVKRAVRFPFLDFSTPERRKAACAAEVAVNRPNAPGLYLGVAAIRRTPQGLALGDADAAAAGVAVEHAVKMHRFDSALTLDHQVALGPLAPATIAALAGKVVAAHRAAPVAEGWDSRAQLAVYVDENEAVFAAEPKMFPGGRELTAATKAELERLAPLLCARAAAGAVRRCHGDLHLRNIVLLDGEPVLFDAVEFNPDIATCDVLYDLAFLLMDLCQRGHRAEANLLLNRYLWAMPDDQIDGLAALPLFLSLRAAIRARVEAAGLEHLALQDRPEAAARIGHIFQCARDFIAPTGPGRAKAPVLMAVGGLSGSGKTTYALGELALLEPQAPGAVVLRSDIERKRLAGVGETERLPPDAYGPEMTERVYARLRDLARRVLAAGRSVVVDAVHARPPEREAIEAVARAASVGFAGFWLEAPQQTLIERVTARTGDASDADATVVRHQLGYDLGPIGWTRVASKPRR